MFALPVILGLLITCHGNLRADAKNHVEPHNGNPVFDQHAYSEKRPKRQSDVVATDEHFEIAPQIAEMTHQDTMNNNVNIKHKNQKNKSARVKRNLLRKRFIELTNVASAFGSKRVKFENPSSMQWGPDTTVYKDGGRPLKWHVGIYTKTTTPYMQICGGTLVTLNVVISAAHCFWLDDKVLSVDQFAVGAGKLFRPWFNTHEIHSQTSDVSAIHIPPRYRGSLTNYQDDIAMVQLTLTLKQSHAVLPACVSFDESLDEEQLGSSTPGTVMGWGLTQPDGRPSQVLNYVELPPLPVDECFEQADPNFIQFITSDKICAGVAGQGLCHGDSGGGLVFLDGSSPPVPYLRGVASTAPRNEHACNTATFAAFTHVFHHRAFLLKHFPRLERDCQRRYKAAKVEDKNACPRLYRRYIRCKKGRVPICI